MDLFQDESFDIREDKRIKLSTIESKYGMSKLTIMDMQLKDLVEKEFNEIQQDLNEHNTIMDETYRLFGISSFFMEQKKLTCLRFDTCYHGNYFEIFYVFLKVSKSSKIPPTVVAHTLPSFFPVEEWEKEYLAHDIQSFTQCISIHLNSFIARRQQFLSVEEEYPKKLEIVASDSYCEMRIMFSDITIKLHYNLDERYPSRIDTVMTNTESAFPQRVKCKVGLGGKIEPLFHDQDLPSVLSLLVPYLCLYNKQCYSSSSSPSITVSMVPLYSLLGVSNTSLSSTPVLWDTKEESWGEYFFPSYVIFQSITQFSICVSCDMK